MTRVMYDESITATKLKATLLGVLDEIARTGKPVTVTKHGKPVVDIIPHTHSEQFLDSIEFVVDEETLIAPLDVDWDAETK